MRTVVGVHGKKRHGKTTAVEFLQREYGGHPIGIADPVKRLVAKMMGFTGEQVFTDLKDVVDPRYGVAPRYFLEQLGLHGRDELGPDVWISSALRSVDHDGLFVVDNVRFPNEMRAINAMRYRSDHPYQPIVIKVVYLDAPEPVYATEEARALECAMDDVPDDDFHVVIRHRFSENASDLTSQIREFVQTRGIR